MNPLGGLLGSVALVAGAYGLVRLTAAILVRTDLPPSRAITVSNAVQRLLVPASVLAAFLLHTFSGTGLAIADALVGSDAPGAAVVLAHATVMSATAVVATAAISRGLDPLRREFLPDDYTPDAQLMRRECAAFVGLVFGSLLVVVGHLSGVLAVHPILVVVVILFLWFSYIQVAHPAPQTWLGTALVRAPTDPERRRLDSCYGRLKQTPPPHVLVYQTSMFVSVMAVGHRGSRSLWLREQFLERASEDDLAVAVAQAEATNRRYLFERLRGGLFLVLTTIAIVTYNNYVTPLVQEWFWIALLTGGLGIAVGWSSRRVVGKADESAAVQLSSDVVVSTYRQFGSEILLAARGNAFDLPVVGPVLARIGPVPSPDLRIDRLTDRRAPR